MRISHSESSRPLIGDGAMRQGKMLGMKRAQILALLLSMMLGVAATTSLLADECCEFIGRWPGFGR